MEHRDDTVHRCRDCGCGRDRRGAHHGDGGVKRPRQAPCTLPAYPSRWRSLTWAAWDWGAAAFKVVIASTVFNVYLTGSVAVDKTAGSAALGWATATAGVIIAVIAPAWGQRGDSSGAANGRQRRLGVMTAVVVLATAALALVRPHPSYLVFGLGMLVVGQVAIQLAEVDYNALLRWVSPPKATGRVSGLGTAALQLGAVVVLSLSLIGFMATQTGWFGVGHAQGGSVRAVAVLCAVWFVVFALPMVLIWLPVSEPLHPASLSRPRGWAAAYRQLWRDLRELRQTGHLLGFLMASALYQDGLAGVFVFFPVLAYGSFGFSPAKVLLFGVAVMVAGAAGAAAGGMLDDHLGPKKIIVGSLIGVVVAVTTMLLVGRPGAVWICGPVASVFIGPALSASRSYLARAAPLSQQGELFGLYACTGRVASFLAPTAFALGVSISGEQRWGMLGITAVLLAGLVALLRVPPVTTLAGLTYPPCVDSPADQARSGIDGKKDERGEQDQVHSTLQPGRPARNDGEHRDDDRQRKQHQLGRAEPEQQRPLEPDRGDRDRRDGQTDTGHRRAKTEVEADLNLVSPGGPCGGDGFG